MQATVIQTHPGAAQATCGMDTSSSKNEVECKP